MFQRSPSTAHTRLPILAALLAALLTACPTPAMPCRDDGDCAALRSRCDHDPGAGDDEGVCVPRLVGPPVADQGRTFGATDGGSSGSVSSSSDASSAGMASSAQPGPSSRVCTGCGDLADGCDSQGQCVCGDHAACNQGQVCAGGHCVCTRESCATGCCKGAMCRPGTSNDACGSEGRTCERCDSEDICISQQCGN